ncbi:Spo0B C-terminal domain-containing protein [Aureibacillus halotolerans]|uniref:Stage 0 sporulation protein B (Sporulation initiation phosphotransferase) n=1 Tax=Aureibacillus halotolerans TaxID=1508390 RepID=A0A4R6TWV3_9BACI|nr:Spo0B C-terminal domain-containing protein [Aureibacillus halotolerans]TDQ37971.1 stage 0 sporulation protein B (sporulation initiation phosphotransferase) [Aureibacillus halotolerans]
MKKWSSVELIRHYRHEWLNKLQIIHGNLQLNNTAEAERIVEQIIHATINESNLTNTGMDRLTEYLLTFSWTTRVCLIDYEVIGEVREIKTLDDAIYTFVSSFVDTIEHNADTSKEQWVAVTLELASDGVHCNLSFEGKLVDEAPLNRWLENVNVGTYDKLENDLIALEVTSRF